MSEPTGPFVGDKVAADEYRAVCLYASAPRQPTCDVPATVHVMVVDHVQHGRVGLSACDTHAPTARASGEFVMEHRHEGYCDFPASLWLETENVCVLDTSGEEPARRAAAVPEVGARR